MVEALKLSLGIDVVTSCKTLEVSRSGYYSWLSRPISQRESENTVLLARIRALHDESRKTYGSPRITSALQSEGLEVNEKRVARIMKENELSSEAIKKFKVKTTDSNHELPIAPREFETENVECVMAPNQVWAGDITYIATGEGWLFLAVFMDIFTRKIVGFSMDDNMESTFVAKALEMAM